MSAINILFFSNHCDGSKQLISLMQKEGLIKFFHLICTDNNPKIPPNITVTPTIMIKGIPTPYVAGDAFAWFAKMKQLKIYNAMQNVNKEQQKYLKDINNNDDDNSNILGFNKIEMNSITDMFSFFSQDENNECNEAFPQSFVSCNDKNEINIYTPPLENGTYKITGNKLSGNKKCKINALKQKELQNKLEQERIQQDKIFKQNIENFRKQYSKN